MEPLLTDVNGKLSHQQYFSAKHSGSKPSDKCLLLFLFVRSGIPSSPALQEFSAVQATKQMLQTHFAQRVISYLMSSLKRAFPWAQHITPSPRGPTLKQIIAERPSLKQIISQFLDWLMRGALEKMQILWSQVWFRLQFFTCCLWYHKQCMIQISGLLFHRDWKI